MNFRLYVPIFSVFLISGMAFASPGYGKCQYKNSGLRAKLYSGKIKELLHGNDGDSCLWSTSTLKPTGKAPSKNDDIAFYEFLSTYSPSKTNDGRNDTAWSEGVTGDGIGEVILVPMDISKPIKIWNGLGKSKSLFKKNNRIKRIKAYYLIPGNIVTESEGVYYFKDLKVVEKHEVDLRDHFGLQKINIPQFDKKKMPARFKYYNGVLPQTILGIEILSVYAGSKYRDTVISEIRNQ